MCELAKKKKILSWVFQIKDLLLPVPDVKSHARDIALTTTSCD